MILPAGLVLALALRCAPGVAPETLLAVARVESGLNPFAVGVNRGAAIRQPSDQASAIAAAAALMSRGGHPDIGLMQINATNLARLGLSLEAAFEPCQSLAAAARLLRADFQIAKARIADDQSALKTALSLYNTGNPIRGFGNGYVARVLACANPTRPRAIWRPLEPLRTSPAPWIVSPTPTFDDVPINPQSSEGALP